MIGRNRAVFLGRDGELERLRAAIRQRESLLVWGPRDSGKSALVARAISALPESVGRRCLYASASGPPQEILSALLQGFAEADDPLLRAKLRAEAGRGESIAQWLKQQSSLRMRGLVYRAAGEGEYWIFLDDLLPMTYMLTRIVKELISMRKTPVYALARGWTYNEIGHGVQLYWNDHLRLHVGALPLPAAKELLEACILQSGLSRMDLDGFREDILEFSGLLPGAIVKMCAAAADSHYHYEDRIKTTLLHVDYLVSHFQGSTQPKGRDRTL